MHVRAVEGSRGLHSQGDPSQIRVAPWNVRGRTTIALCRVQAGGRLVGRRAGHIPRDKALHPAGLLSLQRAVKWLVGAAALRGVGARRWFDPERERDTRLLVLWFGAISSSTQGLFLVLHLEVVLGAGWWR